MNNGIFVQNLLDKPSSDVGLPRNLPNTNPVALPYGYSGDDNWRIDKNSIALVFDTRYGTDTSVTLQLGSSYSVVVDWGDGNTQSYSGSSTINYTYINHGIYIVQIRGSIPNFGASFTNNNRIKTIKCLNLGNNTTTNTTSLSFAFSNSSNVGHPNLIEVPASIPSGVTNLSYCFAGCTALNSPNLRYWNVQNVNNFTSIFNGASSFNQPLDTWDTSSATNMSYAFQSTRFNQPINNWNVSSVTSFRGTFNASAFNQDISGWNISNATDIAGMFSNYTPFNQSINSWNTSKVTDMNSMFFYNIVFNQPLNNWDVSKCTNFINMFNGATSFNGDLSNWRLVASGTTCASMFNNASSFTGSGLNTWDTSGVTNMSNMFANQVPLNQNIGSWNTSNVTNMAGMFYYNSVFNNAGSSSISGWNTTNVTNMSLMFYGSYFNQPIGSWNTSKVTDMSQMFNTAYYFNQDISNWNLAGLNSAASLNLFMNNKIGIYTYSTANYDALLIGWNNNKLASANGIANWRTDLSPNFGGAKYTAGGAAATARAALVTYGWTITDGGSI